MKHLELFENFSPAPRPRPLREHEEGEDIIISYSDLDCQVEMKGILKERFSPVTREYHQYFTPVPDGWSSQCGPRANPSAEGWVQRMKKAYEENTGRDLTFVNTTGTGWEADNTGYGSLMKVKISPIFPVPFEVRITRY